MVSWVLKMVILKKIKWSILSITILLTLTFCLITSLRVWLTLAQLAAGTSRLGIWKMWMTSILLMSTVIASIMILFWAKIKVSPRTRSHRRAFWAISSETKGSMMLRRLIMDLSVPSLMECWTISLPMLQISTLSPLSGRDLVLKISQENIRFLSKAQWMSIDTCWTELVTITWFCSMEIGTQWYHFPTQWEILKNYVFSLPTHISHSLLMTSMLDGHKYMEDLSSIV